MHGLYRMVNCGKAFFSLSEDHDRYTLALRVSKKSDWGGLADDRRNDDNRAPTALSAGFSALKSALSIAHFRVLHEAILRCCVEYRHHDPIASAAVAHVAK